MGAHQLTLNIIYGNLPLPRFQINGGSDRNLDPKIHISHILAPAIIADNVDDQAGIGLTRIEMNGGRFH